MTKEKRKYMNILAEKYVRNVGEFLKCECEIHHTPYTEQLIESASNPYHQTTFKSSLDDTEYDDLRRYIMLYKCIASGSIMEVSNIINSGIHIKNEGIIECMMEAVRNGVIPVRVSFTWNEIVINYADKMPESVRHIWAIPRLESIINTDSSNRVGTISREDINLIKKGYCKSESVGKIDETPNTIYMVPSGNCVILTLNSRRGKILELVKVDSDKLIDGIDKLTNHIDPSIRIICLVVVEINGRMVNCVAEQLLKKLEFVNVTHQYIPSILEAGDESITQLLKMGYYSIFDEEYPCVWESLYEYLETHNITPVITLLTSIYINEFDVDVDELDPYSDSLDDHEKKLILGHCRDSYNYWFNKIIKPAIESIFVEVDYQYLTKLADKYSDSVKTLLIDKDTPQKIEIVAITSLVLWYELKRTKPFTDSPTNLSCQYLLNNIPKYIRKAINDIRWFSSTLTIVDLANTGALNNVFSGKHIMRGYKPFPTHDYMENTLYIPYIDEPEDESKLEESDETKVEECNKDVDIDGLIDKLFDIWKKDKFEFEQTPLKKYDVATSGTAIHIRKL